MAGPDRALGLLGLAARARAVVVGTERVREAVRAGRVRFAVVAADAASGTTEKLVPLFRRAGVPFVRAFDRARLGAAVGRAPASAVGVTEGPLAARLQELLGVDSAGGGSVAPRAERSVG